MKTVINLWGFEELAEILAASFIKICLCLISKVLMDLYNSKAKRKDLWITHINLEMCHICDGGKGLNWPKIDRFLFVYCKYSIILNKVWVREYTFLEYYLFVDHNKKSLFGEES